MKINKLFMPIMLLMALFSALPATASPATVEITHSSGTTKVPLNPKRIIVFDLGVLDNLNRLGINGIVGVPNEYALPAYLKQYENKTYTKAGTLFEPDYETVAALKPDLILVAARSQPKYKELSKLAPTLDLTVSNGHYLSDMERNITSLGKIFAKQKEAAAQIADMKNAIADLKAKAQHQGTGLLILTTGGKISAFGPGSRFGIVYDAFGIKPAAPDLTVGKHGQPVSSEFVAEKNPDWLFVIDRDAAIDASGQSAKQILDNPIISQTSAAKKGQIVYLDPKNWYLVAGGLSGLHETIDQLNQAFAEHSK